MILECNKITQDKNIVVQENRRKFKIQNPNTTSINRVEVDGCYIKNGLRCDYLFEILCEKLVKKVFYVELKGSDVSHAIKQLESTLKKCTKIHKNTTKECFIVVSKYPRSGTSSQNLKKRFRAKNGIPLFIDGSERSVRV